MPSQFENCDDLHMAKLLAQSGRAALLALNWMADGEKHMKEVAISRVQEFMRYCNEVDTRTRKIPG